MSCLLTLLGACSTDSHESREHSTQAISVDYAQFEEQGTWFQVGSARWLDRDVALTAHSEGDRLVILLRHNTRSNMTELQLVLPTGPHGEPKCEAAVHVTDDVRVNGVPYNETIERCRGTLVLNRKVLDHVGLVRGLFTLTAQGKAVPVVLAGGFTVEWK